MSVNRRFVLKGMALSGIAGLTMGGSVRALAATAVAPIANAADQAVLALVNEDVAGSVFLYGAMAARSSQFSPLQVRKVSCELGFILDFERLLRSGQPIRVIGLLDDASAALVVDMARSGGARVQWVGQHSADDGRFTHHHLLNTDIAESCSRQLSRQLHACGAGFSLQEERQNGPLAPRQRVGPAGNAGPSAQWASSLGYLLASLGTSTALAAPLASAASKPPITGSFVSFSIEA